MLNYRFLSSESAFPPFETGPVTLIKLYDMPDVKQFLHLISQTQSVNDTVHSVKWLKYLGHKIKEKSIVTIFAEKGPEFHLVHAILISDDTYQIISKLLGDCFFDEYLQAFKIFNENIYSYCILNMKDVTSNTIISVRNKLVDGYNYISKQWM